MLKREGTVEEGLFGSYEVRGELSPEEDPEATEFLRKNLGRKLMIIIMQPEELNLVLKQLRYTVAGALITLHEEEKEPGWDRELANPKLIEKKREEAMSVKVTGVVLADPLGQMYVEFRAAKNADEVEKYLKEHAHQNVEVVIATAEELKIAMEQEAKKLEQKKEGEKPAWQGGEAPKALPQPEGKDPGAPKEASLQTKKRR